MVFKRRDRRSVGRAMAETLYPRGGWRRAFEYVKHRLQRLPDTPEKIGRGIFAGVLASWTPFYGLHFVIALIFAKIGRGNMLAALLGTFFGNPLTYVPIGVVALQTGHFMLGRPPGREIETSLMGKFGAAGQDLWHNLGALFTPARTDWAGLGLFYHEVFLPYLVGGILPGLISATACYWLFVPVITAYQNRRRRKLRAKLQQLGKNLPETADDGQGPG
ncbi:DUF2062 domain-containing protein [Limimaricola pyoseonensis]|uniref:DUF2062 domain-containing protein n=1 Tax=Limimaricola pyoseonensis TaxID=521013 RepID=A0A1G7E9Q7_9RHOB|nr:DUF2062 domain-containing protein [Limimaricola pyoseonensis]SDE60389.1 hypothetical protein SAMN04488567_2067 [Limimaricola pyoseonensis]